MPFAFNWTGGFRRSRPSALLSLGGSAASARHKDIGNNNSAIVSWSIRGAGRSTRLVAVAILARSSAREELKPTAAT
jgi:hypothetical protein